MGALPRQQFKGVNEQYTLSLRPDERLSRLGKHRFGGACIQIACKFAPDACLYELQRSLALFHISLADGGLPLSPCKLHISLGDRPGQGQSRRCIVEIGPSRGGPRPPHRTRPPPPDTATPPTIPPTLPHPPPPPPPPPPHAHLFPH